MQKIGYKTPYPPEKRPYQPFRVIWQSTCLEVICSLEPQFQIAMCKLLKKNQSDFFQFFPICISQRQKQPYKMNLELF